MEIERRRIAFIVTGLGVGGAEHALANMLSVLDREAFDPLLVVLGRAMELAPRIEATGTPMIGLDLDHGLGLFTGRKLLLQTLKEFRPHLLQGWLYHGNLAASYAGARLGLPVCWSIRDTPDSALRLKLTTRATILLSHWYLSRTTAIFNVSRRSSDYCVHQFGWPPDKLKVLPNGIDSNRFRPDDQVRTQLRSEWGAAEDDLVVGMVARWMPVKNHPLFLEACGKLLAIRPTLKVALAGKGCDRNNEELAHLLECYGLTGCALLLGPRHDIQRIYPALDALALTSRSEGFPNVLAEAMCCGIPVVSTDVGDAESIIGDFGKLVPATAESVTHALDMQLGAGAQIRHDGRQWIMDHFDLHMNVRRLEHHYMKILG